jgi:hypothetical protein
VLYRELVPGGKRFVPEDRTIVVRKLGETRVDVPIENVVFERLDHGTLRVYRNGFGEGREEIVQE